MDKETERRRSWLWKKKNGFGEGGTSPTPVKLFDEQEVARMLEDQVRSQQDQMECTLREVDEKYSEKEKAISEKLDTVNTKLTSAFAEITVKDNLVKQHIKVAEEAVIGWERAENEAAAFKVQLDDAVQQQLATEDRVQHLDSALKEVMKQLRIGREEQEHRIHEIIVEKTQEYDKLRAQMESKEQRVHESIVKKTQEYDELRAEMKSKLTDASHLVDQTRAEMELKLAESSHIVAQMRAELMESRAENQAVSKASQDRSGALAEVSDAKARAETNSKVLQVRLEGMEKENIDLKNDIRLVSKRLESRMSELEHAKKVTDVASRQLAEALKKVTKLDEECTRLRPLVRKKLPSAGYAGMARLKQDVDPSGRNAGRSPRRRPLGRGQSEADQEENLQLHLEAKASAERILNLQEETRTLKEALGKRDEELQRARIMCAKTASRLSSVEEEVEALKLASRSASQVEKASPEIWASNASSILSMSSLKTLPSKRDSLNFELMDDFEDMERLANSQSQPSHSISGSEHTVEAAVVFGGVDDATYQLRIAGLEEALAGKDRDLEASNETCHELSSKLAVAEEQLVFLQKKSSANEHLVVDLQDRLDSLLENQARRSESDGELVAALRKLVHITEALAQATGTESSAAKLDHNETSLSMSNSVVLSLHWQDPTLDILMSSLVLAANAFLQTGADVLKFFVELTTTLDCILIIHITAKEELRKNHDASAEERLAASMELEFVRVQVSQLEEELCRIRAERADAERKIQVETTRFSQFESEILQLKTEKNELENNLSEMDQHLVDANRRVEGLWVRLNEAEALVTELQTRQAEHDKEEKEEDLIERELLELSDPSLRLAANMRAADEEMHQLHDKVAALEVELHGERRRHQDVVAKLTDLQEQIHRGVNRVDHSPGRSNSKNGDYLLQLALVEDDATKSARKEKDIAAAALAECQRTILALGKQLKVLGLQEPSDISQTNSPASPDSIEQMTHTMEFLRSQADSNSGPSAAPGTSLIWAPRASRPALPGLYYRQFNNNGSGNKNGVHKPTDGPLLLSVELPDSSNPDSTLASPASPARVLRSVRTIRGSTSLKTSENDTVTSSTIVEGITNLESRSTLTTSTFKRFYTRSQSETSMSSDPSSPGPV